MQHKYGILYLIPSWLNEHNTTAQVLPAFNVELINSIKYYIVEDLRTARRFMRQAGFTGHFDELTFFELNKHTPQQAIDEFIKPLLAGHHIGLISEAGNPCIADPGALVTTLAHELKITIRPLVGPSSILLALIASGFNGQYFTFHGYLPIDKQERIKKIKQMEQRIYHEEQTQIFMETPFRNNQLLADLLAQCHNTTKLCIACNITAPEEKIVTQTIVQWKNTKINLHKLPTVFLLFK